MMIITRAKPGFDYEALNHYHEAVTYVGLDPAIEIILYDCYTLNGVAIDQVDQIKSTLFNANRFDFIDHLPEFQDGMYISYRQVAGQYNEHEVMLQELLTNVLGVEEATIAHSRILAFDEASSADVTRYKKYYLNPVEFEEIPLGEITESIVYSSTEDLQAVDNFIEHNQEQLTDIKQQFSMDLADLTVVQDYFKKEGRNPNWTELKVIDTYWSDHCRHTTFNTELDRIDIEDGPYAGLFKNALEDYLNKRQALNRSDKPMTLMDMGTIQAKYLREQGLLNNVEISAEVNACALEIMVDVDGQEEEWILYFKNETHNHPTEIEPFGGASTCVGGGVRDPLSGRSFVYQAMRISGAHDPRLTLEETRTDKLSQRQICQGALAGNSDYSNQIGLTAGFAEEVYHPGFEAKRMEVGALIAATPKSHVVRQEPQEGDVVLLLGGKTGRDGLGAAVGSSQVQTEESLKNAGAEVQKGAAATERKIVRLFRRPEATTLIKRCNDFGAGGIAVAVGEIADGLAIDLDAVPVKYPGMHGGEIALSESQERMAVVVERHHVEAFMTYCQEEDVEAAVIAEVTNDERMQMSWQGQVIIDLKRDLLDSNGAAKHEKALLSQPEKVFDNDLNSNQLLTQDFLEDYVSDLNRASQKAMAENFDASINRGTVLYPYGGAFRATQELGMVSKLPVAGGKTTTCSAMTYGFDPYLAENSPFHGGYYAVIESVTRLVCMGFDYQTIRLTFQEYFESLLSDPVKWGKPVLALLGANTAMTGLDLASIGGKDSMSGTYQELTVPPSLISFAVAHGNVETLISRAFKSIGSHVVLIENPLLEGDVLDLEQTKAIYQKIYALAKDQKILAASSIGTHGLLKEILEMSFGNRISIELCPEMAPRLLEPMMGSIILELSATDDLADVLDGLPYHRLGTTKQGDLVIEGQTFDLNQIYQASVNVLDPIYQGVQSQSLDSFSQQDHAYAVQTTEDLNGKAPKALVPVLLGTNGEYDLIYSLEAAGFLVESLVLKTSSYHDFEASIERMIEALSQVHLLALPNGYIFGNEPHHPGKAWQIILNRPEVKKAIEKHLDQKRLIMGIGSSFVALIETGLIEYGQITNQTHIKVQANSGGKFISDVTEAHIISNHSAFTRQVLGKSYTAPIATAFGRIQLAEAATKMHEQGQVLSVFTNYFNDEAIDALASPDGQIFGTLSGFERITDDLMINLPSISSAPFLDQAYTYFV